MFEITRKWSHSGHVLKIAAVGLVLGLTLPAASGAVWAADQQIEIRDGDRIVLLGDAFIERLQTHGYFEAALLSRLPQKNLVIRNLGWSGDTVQGIARAVFGSPEEGYKRLLKDTRDVKPTLIVVCYGGNEAYAGDAGLPAFEKQLNRLLDDLQSTGARLALLAPTRQANTGAAATRYNRQLDAYVDRLSEAAERRGARFVNLAGAMQDSWKDNRIHFSDYGYWRFADALAAAFGARKDAWEVRLNMGDKSYDAVNVAVSDLAWGKESIAFQALDRQLPKAAKPEFAPRNDGQGFGRIQVQGLPAGQYELSVGEQRLAAASAADWARGVTLPERRGGSAQSARLRELVNRKNELFFYRYRPQNETYLFLFRKHEQGNNAAEIPQFDPLIAKIEAEIEPLRRPVEHAYLLQRTGD